LPEPPDHHRVRLPTGLGAAEMHAHTTASDGMVTADELVTAAAAIGLSVICVTDHDTIPPIDQARETGARLGVEVVAGEEVTTAIPLGIHVVGLFLERPVRMGMSLEDTVDAIHDHGGLAILAHPFMPTLFASVSPRRALRLIEHRSVDGVELRHTQWLTPRGRDQLDRFYAGNRERVGAALGAGDSHFGARDLGRLVTTFPGHTAADLRRAIEARRTAPLRGVRPAPPTLGMRLAQQRRALLWLPAERRAGRVGRGVGPHRDGQTPATSAAGGVGRRG
jgi:predicted metal-dependent phosphoesterase TrpH